MLEKLAQEWTGGANRFARPGECYLGLFHAGQLCAVGGLNRDPYPGGEGLGRIRHLYVPPHLRRRGHGAMLLTHLLAAARPAFPALRLRTANPAAARLYEAHGFERVEQPFASHMRLSDEDSAQIG